MFEDGGKPEFPASADLIKRIRWFGADQIRWRHWTERAMTSYGEHSPGINLHTQQDDCQAFRVTCVPLTRREEDHVTGSTDRL